MIISNRIIKILFTMKLNFSTLIASIFISLLLSSCSPSVVDISLYTTDIEAANKGEVFEVPVRASFTLYSEDDGELESASIFAEKY